MNWIWPKKVHTDQLADVTHLGAERIRQLAKHGYFPKAEEGWYQTFEALSGLFRYYQENKQGGASLRDKKLSAEIRKINLWNEQKAGELIPFEDVERFMVAIVSAAKTEARRVILELQPKIIGLDRPEAELKIEAEISKAFNILSDLCESLGKLQADAKKAAIEHDDDDDRGANPQNGQPGPEGPQVAAAVTPV